MTPEQFTRAVLNWFARHGRHDLPWQHSRSAYRVWVSEIMLQQTQVSTVIPYFRRFMSRFVDVIALANAELDDVLHQWTGLGYYARARNLHKAAQHIRDDHGGVFPDTFEQVAALPGIGRSTAGAILAQAFGQCHPILDGNVKRVLTRFHAVDGWPGNKAVEEQLWDYAARYTPRRDVADYTQAIMDLGATVCTRSRPQCPGCPLRSGCQAYHQGEPTRFPAPKPRRAMPVKQTVMLMLEDERGQILLEQRPPSGIWGSLWSLPECPPQTAIRQWCRRHLALDIGAPQPLPALRHTFSHFHLEIQPVRAHVEGQQPAVMESPPRVWYNTRQPDARGLPAPVKQLLAQIAA
jgi:A/G-specific adenine glycosylase